MLEPCGTDAGTVRRRRTRVVEPRDGDGQDAAVNDGCYNRQRRELQAATASYNHASMSGGEPTAMLQPAGMDASMAAEKLQPVTIFATVS